MKKEEQKYTAKCCSSGHDAKSNHEHHHDTKLMLTLYFIGLILFFVAIFIKDFNFTFLKINFSLKNILFLLTTILSGYHVIFEGFEDTIKSTIKKKKFSPNVHILMTLAAVGAMLINEFQEGALLILIFAGAHYLEDYAEGKSQREIQKLLKLHPETARRINEDGTITIVNVSELVIGDQLQVLNGDQVPTDGVIISGESDIDEASITGESIPKIKSVGDEVFGSTINGNGTFTMEVTKNSDETIIAKIIELVSQTQTNISKTAVKIKKIEPIYVTVVLLFAPIFYLFGRFVFNWDNSFYRTMVLLIGASPCAIAATDIPATLSAISNLAKHGVLFKGGSYLSNFADINSIAFDKTGTITEGKPVVTDVYFKNKDKEKQYIDIIVAMEKQSNHPLARAIVNHFKIDLELDLEVTNILGTGITTNYNNNNYKIGKPSSYKVISQDIVEKTNAFENDGKTVVYFGINDEVVGLIAIQDIPKEQAYETIKYFNDQNIKTVMITGDAIKTGNAIGNKIGITEVRANVLPEQKSNIINELKENNEVVAMIGDGVNDAPALVASDIGIAMGDGTDIAIDVADAVLMQGSLEKLKYTHQVSKKLKTIVWQNIIFASLVILFLVVVNFLGMMNMKFAVIIHETSTLIVILNGLRMLKTIKNKDKDISK